ncbi:glucosamine-6-phosphate isomerase-like isoform X2 [Homarus americanus]|uniref:glucosamine-6-phosphate isomerase-like isoform X2 n=1 Tax=Homarus americanus TaxID=6706 RepID=UPI001C48F815|nr:glucosamine-6-phosphate isomerase-like isoform X2 [Homarus americanus]
MCECVCVCVRLFVLARQLPARFTHRRICVRELLSASASLSYCCHIITTSKMRLVILEDSERVAEWAARYVIKRINDFQPGPDKYFVLGLPTGSTPEGTYKKLVQYHMAGKISFKYVKTFNMDEYVGIPRDHVQSYHTFMWESLFKHIDINPVNVHILNGNAEDLEQECLSYEKKIVEAGGIELFIGGIGPDGHIAFNEPGSSLVSRTRVKTLNQETITANARFFNNDISQVPKQALTVGVGTVMEAREVMVLITGSHKAYALHMAIEEGVNHMWTVSAFQQHKRTIMLCDEDATLELKVKTVKYFRDLWTVHCKLIDDPMMVTFT